jgi:sugar phosphate isomerase/epimerase
LQLGLFTPVFGKLSFVQLLEELKRYPQIKMIELGTGGWPGESHIDVEGLLANSGLAREYRQRIRDAGLNISALSCHSNPVHPVAGIAKDADTIFRKTVKLAELLEVPVVVTFSGCPGGSPDDKTPNWITAAWPTEFGEALTWQWESKLIPYWKDAAYFAGENGVKVALEAHPGFCVYNPETLLRLRAAVGPAVGINMDPSHLWWQGMDIPQVIAELGDAIHHVHAKDVALNQANIAKNGVLDTKSYAQMQQRSWLFRSVGCGHGELDWKQIVASLRLAGYDYVMSIEHEDALASIHEGLSSAISMLSRVLLTEPPVEAWWL